MAALPYETTTIASGQTVGAEFDLRGKRLCAIRTPAALTGVTLSFQAAEKPTELGGTYKAVWHTPASEIAEALTITSVSTSMHIILNPDFRLENCMMKLVSGSAEGATRTFQLVTEVI